MQQDIFHAAYERYINWAGSIPDGKFSAIVRLLLLFAVPTAIYYWKFVNRLRGGPGRCIAACIADALVLAIPIPAPNDIRLRAWIITVAALLLAYLPGIHPFFVCPEAGRQKRLRAILYGLLFALVAIGILKS